MVDLAELTTEELQSKYMLKLGEHQFAAGEYQDSVGKLRTLWSSAATFLVGGTLYEVYQYMSDSPIVSGDVPVSPGTASIIFGLLLTIKGLYEFRKGPDQEDKLNSIKMELTSIGDCLQDRLEGE